MASSADTQPSRRTRGSDLLTDHDMAGATPDSLLATAIAAVAHTGDPDLALDALLLGAAQAAGADRGAVVLWDAEHGRLVVAASFGYIA